MGTDRGSMHWKRNRREEKRRNRRFGASAPVADREKENEAEKKGTDEIKAVWLDTSEMIHKHKRSKQLSRKNFACIETPFHTLSNALKVQTVVHRKKTRQVDQKDSESVHNYADEVR